MAITASGLYYTTFRDILGTAQLAVDLDLETNKLALFNNTLSPNFDSDTSYAVSPYDANEVTGTGWSSGGVALTGTAISVSPAGTLMWDATDVSQAGTTLSNAEAALIYADPLSPKRAICLVDFTTPYSTVSGTFAITWAATGVFTIDLTP